MQKWGVFCVAPGILLALLMAACTHGAAHEQSRGLYRPVDLPAPVVQTRSKLLKAAQAGDLQALQPILEQAEYFQFSYAVASDPIAYWQQNVDRQDGQTVLRALAQVLALPAARKPDGAFVWPYLSSMPAQPYEELTPEQAADVSLLMTREDWNRRAAEVGYTGYRLTIRADGTWIGFIAGD
ncbi:MAG: hypothetical protein ACQETX_14045 [Pseudomonadota bacterium]